MRKLLVPFILYIVLSAGCGPTAAPAPGSYPDLSVKMQYSGWWGQGCYQLIIAGDGIVTYSENDAHGCGNLNRVELGKLSPQQMQVLVDAIKRANGWAIWAVNHPLGGGYICSDCPKIDLSFTLNGQSEHISHWMTDWQCKDQFSPPKAVCDLENQIAAMRYWDIYRMPTLVAPAATP